MLKTSNKQNRMQSEQMSPVLFSIPYVHKRNKCNNGLMEAAHCGGKSLCAA